MAISVFFWTAFLSILPISELRGAIPFAIAHEIPWYLAYPLAACLNALAAPLCWLFLSTAHKLFMAWAEKRAFRWYRILFEGFVEKARKRLRLPVEKWGWLGIAVFVAVPLPITGAWTGTLGAWILGLGKGRTMAAVTLGVFCAGAMVTLVVMLGLKAFSLFLKQV
jgi:uncharacterized membrane protein